MLRVASFVSVASCELRVASVLRVLLEVEVVAVVGAVRSVDRRAGRRRDCLHLIALRASVLAVLVHAAVLWRASRRRRVGGAGGSEILQDGGQPE